MGGTILVLSATPMALCYLAMAFFAAFVAPGAFYTNAPNDIARQAGEVVSVLAIGALVAAPVFLAALGYVSGMVSQMVSDWLVGNRPDESAATRAAVRALPALLGAGAWTAAWMMGGVALSLLALLTSAFLESNNASDDLVPALAALVGALGFLFSLVGGPLVAAFHGLAPAAIVNEGLSPRQAIRRSSQLLAEAPGHGPGHWTMFSLGFVVFLVWLSVGLGTLAALSLLGIDSWLDRNLPSNLAPLAQRAVGMAPWFLALWTAVPVWATGTTVVYFDRRVRKEGFDIELLARRARASSREARFRV
jgi:hypothetical protein